MKFWLDTEFIEDGRTIELISIAIVAENGREYYAEFADCDLGRASSWVRDNVIPHLRGPRRERPVIRDEIVAFMGDRPEIWGYYADYDWVALCQLFGTMMDLPKGWPKFCRDVQQLAAEQPKFQLPLQGGNEHHALDDARWIKAAFESLSKAA